MRRAAGAPAPNFIPDPCAWLSSQFCTDLVACLRLTSLVSPHHGGMWRNHTKILVTGEVRNTQCPILPRHAADNSPPSAPAPQHPEAALPCSTRSSGPPEQEGISRDLSPCEFHKPVQAFSIHSSLQRQVPQLTSPPAPPTRSWWVASDAPGLLPWSRRVPLSLFFLLL